ncbi:hypothetical protein HHK36_003438 [Tetracentron sinense]|uniref:B-like cyclin n=1 Tax=Tetracentron sinense TaxID=13715 RepID=A0A834ZXN7_TETSI|nr:hypothetical protein HHK36_003438 [Tetracentron sinense]
MAHEQSNTHIVVYDLYCKEEHWVDEEEEREINNISTPSLLPHLLLEEGLFPKEDELHQLLSKEEVPQYSSLNYMQGSLSLAAARRKAVEWILVTNSHHTFSPLTAVLSVNYLDRFLATLQFQRDKPWMMHLVTVACLSIAAKVEETKVPLLLDLQVQKPEFIFEPKSIQKMELLVLSTLGWKMNPVTPISFINYIVKRLDLVPNKQWEFLTVFERLLLAVVADSRFVHYRPSVFAAAITLHVIDQLDSSAAPGYYKKELMDILKISKERLEVCYQLVMESRSNGMPEFKNVSYWLKSTGH